MEVIRPLHATLPPSGPDFYNEKIDQKNQALIRLSGRTRAEVLISSINLDAPLVHWQTT